MKTKTLPFKKVPIAEVVESAMDSVTTFDWHDVFYAGTHTDNSGTEHTYTREQLEEVVANFAANKVPLVIGHPKLDAPAWGWVSEVRLTDDDRLEIKADNVNVEFAKKVAAKTYPNRSVRLARNKNGLELVHIGYLGGAAPALEGLRWQYSGNVEDTETIEFSLDTYQKRNIFDIFGRMRDFFIDKFGQEAADTVIPKWSLDQSLIDIGREEASIKDELDPFFSKPQTKEPDVGNITQEQLDAAVKKVKDDLEADFSSQLTAAETRAQAAEDKLSAQEYAARVETCQALIDAKVAAGVLIPAQTEGLAEFMASLNTESATFSFSKGEGKAAQTVEQSQFDFAKGFLDSLGTKSPLGDETQVTETHHDDLDVKAEAYAKAHNVSYSDAVIAVSEEG